jgi:hypothetical protein
MRGIGTKSISFLTSGCVSHAAWSIGCTGRMDVLPRVKRAGLITCLTVTPCATAAAHAMAAIISNFMSFLAMWVCGTQIPKHLIF